MRKMKQPREQEALPAILVRLLDKKLPVENMPGRKRISVRELLLRKLIERAELGHAAALRMLAEFRETFRDPAIDEDEDDKAFEEACANALEKYGSEAAKNMSESKERSVGYGSPPVATRFEPGRSGNPRGRPRGSKNCKTLLAKLLEERVQPKPRAKRVSRFELMLENLI